MLKKIIRKFFLLRKLKKDRNKFPLWEKVISKKDSNFIFKALVEQYVEIGVNSKNLKLYFFSFTDLKTNKKKLALVIKASSLFNGSDITIKTTVVDLNKIKTYWIVFNKEKNIIYKFYTKSVKFVEAIKILI